MKAKLSDLIDAMEMLDQYSVYYFDKTTGEIEYVNEYVMDSSEIKTIKKCLEEHDYCELPSSFDIHEYRIMEDFVETFSGTIYDALTSAIQGKGAFRRFKNALYHFRIEKEWYDFKHQALKQKAIRWCKDYDIEYEE